MPSLTVRPFEASDIETASELLAARQMADRALVTALDPGLEDAEVCATHLVEPIARSRRAEGVAALRNGRIVGFLFGERMTFAPTEFPSMFIAPHSISIPVHGHAVERGEDVSAVYRAMYGYLAAGWTRRGFFIHQSHIFAADAELQEAWVALGFGRMTTAAIRATEPVTGTLDASIEVHRASAEDLEVVMALADTLFKFHSTSPIFWPFLNEPQAAAREAQRALLDDPRSGYFIAYRDGRPIAMQTYNVPGFTPAIVPRQGNVYLFEGVVEPDVRGGGIGTRLLAEGMAWARQQGHQWCTLHFASANPSGGPFWLGHGFRPVEYTMVRHIDERVAWANGWDD